MTLNKALITDWFNKIQKKKKSLKKSIYNLFTLSSSVKL